MAQPQPWGTFVYPIAPEKLIRNLEQGGAVNEYNPARLGGSELKLEAPQKRFPNKTVVTPNEQLKVPLALTAWRRLYTLGLWKIVAFIKCYNCAPERFSDQECPR